MYNGLSKKVAFAQNWGILKSRRDQRGDDIKISFNYFQIQKSMLQAVRAKKARLKKVGSFF